MSYWDEVDAKREAQRDFERRGCPNWDMNDRYGTDAQREYADEFARLRRDDERKQEERHEEERVARRAEENRQQSEAEENRQQSEAEYYERLARQEEEETNVTAGTLPGSKEE